MVICLYIHLGWTLFCILKWDEYVPQTWQYCKFCQTLTVTKLCSNHRGSRIVRLEWEDGRVSDTVVPYVGEGLHCVSVQKFLLSVWSLYYKTSNKSLKLKFASPHLMHGVLYPQYCYEKHWHLKTCYNGFQVNKALKPCLEYNLWNLHKSKHFNMSKHEQRSLNILIRNRVDGKLVSLTELSSLAN